MSFNEEKARILYKLIRRGKISMNCYDRLDFYKRFNKKAIEGLKKEGFVVISRRGKKFDSIYIPNKRIKEAEEFVEKYYEELK